eukprot:197327_1
MAKTSGFSPPPKTNSGLSGETKSNAISINVEIGGVEDKLRLVIKSEYGKEQKMNQIFGKITGHLNKKYVVKNLKKYEIDVIHSGFTGAVEDITELENKSLTEYDVNEIKTKGLSVEVSICDHHAAIFSCKVQLVLMVPAIAAMIIAAVYDKSTSPCGVPYCGSRQTCSYTIHDLDLFLSIVGTLQIVYGLYYLYVARTIVGKGSPGRFDVLEGLFLFIMAIIGFIMWFNQFSDACKGQPVAIMILTWSIIPFVHLVVAFFCPYAG